MKNHLEFDNSWAPSVEELLKSHAEKPVRRFLTVDVFGLDEKGASLHCYPDFELRNSDLPVRVYIAEGTSKGEVLFYLSEIIKELKKEGHHFGVPGEGRYSG